MTYDLKPHPLGSFVYENLTRDQKKLPMRGKNGRPLLPPECKTPGCTHERMPGKGLCRDCFNRDQNVRRAKRKSGDVAEAPVREAYGPRNPPKVRIRGCPPGWPSAARSRSDGA